MKWEPSVPQPPQEILPMCAKYFGESPKIIPLISLSLSVSCRCLSRLCFVCSSIVEEGLSYRFHASWPFVMQVLACFYRVAGKKAHPIMTKVFLPEIMKQQCARKDMLKFWLTLCGVFVVSRSVPAVAVRPALHSSVPLQWGVGLGGGRSCGEHGA